MNQLRVVCFGEVLWDLFPSGKKIGGAPLNVAFRLSQRGISTTLISAIGEDTLGKELKTVIEEIGISAHLQINPTYSTGSVGVQLDEEGSATYTVESPVAWDAIIYESTIERYVEEANCLVFGSLVTRGESSKNTLKKIITKANYKVFDVNLRKPHYQLSDLLKWMRLADLIKCNEEELKEIVKYMGCKEIHIEKQIVFLAKQTVTQQVCVTLGSKGAVWYEDSHFIYQSGFETKVADTVGAGDSFLGTLLAGLLGGQPRADALEEACAMGAMVASRMGANPIISQKELINFKGRANNG